MTSRSDVACLKARRDADRSGFRHASDAADDSQQCLRAIARAQAGDREALGYVYSCYSESVLKYVRTIVRDDHEAQDVTQHVFAKVITAITAYERQAVPFSAWILRVARNAAIDHLRGRRSIPQADVRGDDLPVDEIGNERRRELVQALEGLPADQREVLVLRHLLGLSPSEIAERLGRTEVAVHSLHYRARRILCRELVAAGSAPSRGPARGSDAQQRDGGRPDQPGRDSLPVDEREKRPAALVHRTMATEPPRPLPTSPVSLRPTVAVVASDDRMRSALIDALHADGLSTAHAQSDPCGLVSEAREASAPDIILVGCECAAAVRSIAVGLVRDRFPLARVVLVAPESVSARVLRGALRANFDAVVLASQVTTALAPTVRAVNAEQVVFPRGLSRDVDMPVLSRRERDVLRFVVAGCTNDEIANRLYLATSTVKCHLTSAFAKLGARSRDEAVSILLDPEHPAGHTVLRGGEEWAAPARGGVGV
ncbi:MAG TPA: sigma-70 family RNA polymerase sigma factor [Thermoleophilaceae bacterium]